MALTKAQVREILSEAGVSKENMSDAVEKIIDGHLASINALREEADQNKKELEELRAADGGYRQKYEDEKNAFAEYKKGVAEKEASAQKAKLYRAALKAAGVDEKRYDAILRATDMSKVTVKDGKLADEAAVLDAIKRDWGDFIPTTTTTGTKVENPPVNSGAGMTREQILAIKDASARQKAIAENIDQFK